MDNSTEEEIWKPVVGFEEAYQISNLGRLRSIDRYIKQKNKFGETYDRFKKGRILKKAENSKRGGYFITCLKSEEKRRTVCHHILVAEAFLGPRPDGMVIDHLNENPKDNRAVNLRYISRGENFKKAMVRNYGPKWQRGEHFVTSDHDLYCETCGRKY